MSLISIPGISSQWTAAGGGPTTETLYGTSDVTVEPTGITPANAYEATDNDTTNSPADWTLRAPEGRSTLQTRLVFDTDGGTITPAGTGNQTINLLIRKVDRDGVLNPSNNATYSVVVDGTTIASGQSCSDGTSGGETASFTFDASVYTAYGTSVRIDLDQTNDGGGSPGNRAFIECGAFELVAST